jgi:hypothetical protein
LNSTQLRKRFSYLMLSVGLLAAPASVLADQLVPAGSVIHCTIAEPKGVSSKTEAPGDPVLCQLGHSEAFGRTSFPYGAYLVGRFVEYKDPGHFVGKGWMELRFERLIVQPDTIVPINARVVATPKYPVDAEGRIHGTGHAVKDTVEWLIPVLWPIDLINLPRRGPVPVLKPETQLTLKILDDFGIPTPEENAVRTPALISRQTEDEPTYQNYRPAPVGRRPDSQYAQQNYPQQQQGYAPQYATAQQYAPPVQQAYSQPSVVIVQSPPAQPQPIIVNNQAPPVVYNNRPRYVPYPAPYAYRMGPYGPYPVY